MSLKDEQKVMRELNDLLYPKIKGGTIMTQKQTKTKVTKKKPAKEIKSYQIENELKKMYPKMSAGEIARKHGVSRGVILNQLKKFNIKITTRTSPKAGQRRTDVDRSFHKKEYLTKQLREGLTIYAIAKECGCGYMQVFHMVEKHGLTKLAQEMKIKKAEKKKTPKKKTQKK